MSLTKTGAGTQILSGANTYSGATTVSTGILAIGHKDALNGTSGISVATGGATLRIDVPDTISTTIGNGKSVSIAGNGDSVYGALQGAASTSVTWAGNVSLAASTLSRIGGGASGTLTVDGVISGTDATAGVLFSRAPNSTTILNKVNTFTGGTRIDSGTLALSHATDTLADTGAVNVNGGTLTLGNFGAYSDSVGAVTLTSGSITVTTGTLTGSSYDIRSGSVTAMLGGTGVALTKSTSGTVTLSGANAYDGATTVDGGVLNITGSTASGSAVAVGGASATGTPKLAGSGTINGAVTVKSAGGGAVGLLDAGDAAGSNPAGKLAVNNNLTFEAASIFEWDIKDGSTMSESAEDRGVQYDAEDITGGGSLSVNDSVFRVVLNTGDFSTDTFWDTDRTWASSSIFDVGGSLGGFTTLEWNEGSILKGQSSNLAGRSTDGFFTISGTSLNWTAVPELSNVLIGGLLGVGLLRRRRN